MDGSIEQSGVVTIDYAIKQDAVLIESHPKYGGLSTNMITAKVIERTNGYDIIPVGCLNSVRVSKESYGKTWRCWEIKKPSMIDRNNVAWD